jgi:uncharacterized protein YdeI (BOF family)
MKRNFFFCLFALAGTTVLFLFSPYLFSPVEAGFFGFDKASYSVDKGKTVEVKVTVDGGIDNLSSVDAYILYDSTIVTATSVAAGSFFPTVLNDITTAGKVYIAGMFDDPATSASGSGTVATISFQGQKDGATKLTFDCNSSKIVKNDINATNIIECSKNGTSDVVIGGSYLTTPAPTPSILPKTGFFENVVKFAVPGAILLFIGAAVRLLL